MSATVTDLTERRLGQEAVDVKREEADDLVLYSVTTVIGVLDKPALIWWSADQTAQAAIDNAELLPQRIQAEGESEVYEWLRRARFRSPKDRLTAADLGTVFHDCANKYALSGQRPSADEVKALVHAKGGKAFRGVQRESDVVGQMLDQFEDWLGRFSPSYIAAEVAVYNPRYGYAGQLDAIFSLSGTRLLGDYKTTREPLDSKGNPRTPYPEQVGLQLALYRYAEFAAVWRPRRTEKFRRRFYLLSPLERELAVPVPEVDGAVAIHITPSSCEAFPIRADEQTFRYALNCIECFRWVNYDSKDAMAPPLEAP